MSFLAGYLTLGVLLVLWLFAWVRSCGISLTEFIEGMLTLESGKNGIHVVIFITVLFWPIVLWRMYEDDDPTGSA